MIEQWADQLNNIEDDVARTSEEAARKSDFERTELNKDKTGVKLDGVAGNQSGKRQADPDFRFRLCTDGLRHRCHHGCPGAR